MSGQIFISYRREESQWSARSLHDRLCRDFDPKLIFMDIDAIALGEDFVKAIETTVERCDLLIAVIGSNWLSSKDDHGDRRLDNPEDFVRMEIGTALRRDIRVIPVLVDGAAMPRSADLPEDLKSLVRRNALRITATSFDGDCKRLTAAIRLVLEKAVQPPAVLSPRADAVQECREKESIAPSQDRGPVQPETPPVTQNHRREAPKLLIRLGLLLARLRVQLAICAMVLIVVGVLISGLYLTNIGKNVALPSPTSRDYINRGWDLYQRGFLEHQRDLLDEAISNYIQAIRLDPKNADAYYNRALAYQREGKSAQASDDFAKAKQLGYAGTLP
jgi:tetratricopeptide (TPR) repeat protein